MLGLEIGIVLGFGLLGFGLGLELVLGLGIGIVLGFGGRLRVVD